jgi:hypothetical protein
MDLIFTQGDGEGVELLTQGHRHGVLQLGTAHFQDMFEFLGFDIEGGDECFQSVQGGVGAVDHGHAETGGVGIVGGLALVDVIVGVDDVVATLSSPISSRAMLASTSLVFMLTEVPAPP